MWKELQLEGLVGPTHNYSGLSDGNVASANNAGLTSNPKEAALQSLSKMEWLHEQGVPVAISPPHRRPDFSPYSRLGLVEKSHFDEIYAAPHKKLTAEWLRSLYDVSPKLFHACWSSSNMWTANSATVTIADNTGNSIVHLTPANLISTLHRSLEKSDTERFLRQVFSDTEYFLVHDALSTTSRLNDEGAANHMWLNDKNNTHIFVFGSKPPDNPHPALFPSRQQFFASEIIASHHTLKAQQAIFVQQHPNAIDAGIFHNDVISMSHWQFLAYHEASFVDDSFIDQLGVENSVRKILESELSLEEAVKTYFFNAQIITNKSASVIILFPSEVEAHPKAKALAEKLKAEDNPIDDIAFMDLRQSMRNGGGPACLRLRVPVTDAHLQAMHQGIRFTPRLHDRLKTLIEQNYPDSLTPQDLLKPDHIPQFWDTHKAIQSLLSLS
ncbi:MAG: N-succinylarginine dihydrolase [Rickettsiales bacterium]|nr:N-succinylarginine dihydrolase [Rickettsiales bacterium]